MIESAMSNSINPMLENVKAASKDLPESMTRLNLTVYRMDAILADQQQGLADTMLNVRSMSQNLKELTDTAREYPSLLLFGEPPPKVDLNP